MKKILVSLIGALAFAAAASASVKWYDNLEDGLKAARAERKPALVLFTGSDWCPPCMAMEKSVFSSSEFEAFAQENLVLIKLEFLRKTEQPAAQKAANEAACKRYGVNAFPSMFIVDGNGKVIAKEVGGMDKEEFLKWLNAHLKKTKKVPAPNKAP